MLSEAAGQLATRVVMTWALASASCYQPHHEAPARRCCSGRVWLVLAEANRSFRSAAREPRVEGHERRPAHGVHEVQGAARGAREVSGIRPEEVRSLSVQDLPRRWRRGRLVRDAEPEDQ